MGFVLIFLVMIINNYLPATKLQTFVQSCKRKLAKKDTFIIECTEKGLIKFFNAFENAKEKFSLTMKLFPPQSRSRGFEASVFQTCLLGELQKVFPEKWKFWKYKRFVITFCGHSFLFKKLNKKGMPMNIKTNANQSIINQMQTQLFDPTDYENPIVFFGWEKSKSGDLTNPHFVYIDEGKIKWGLRKEELTSLNAPTILTPNKTGRLLPKVKEQSKRKKAI